MSGSIVKALSVVEPFAPSSIGTNDDVIEVEVDVEGEIDKIVEQAVRDVGKALPHTANLVLALDDEVLSALGRKVIEIYEADERTRTDWKETYRDALRLLGIKEEKRTTPWAGACGVIHPMITEAVIRFQANTIMEMFPLHGPFKADAPKTDETLVEVAQRLQTELNYIATKVMVEYRTEIEQGLWRLGLAGMVFRKVWMDPSLKRPIAQTIPAEDIVVPFGSSHIYSTPRITQIIKLHREEVDRYMASGWWFEVDLPDVVAEYTETQYQEGEQQGISPTLEYDNRYTFYEMQIDLNLDGFEYTDDQGVVTGLPLPYVVTVERQSQKVMAVRRNYAEGDTTHARMRNITASCYIPGWGFYGIGLLNLMAGLASGATSILRQTVDAGTLANLPAGYKGKGFKTRNDTSPLRPGEFRDVELYSGKIADNIYQLQFGEPSQTLVALMANMVEEGRRLGAVAELPTKTGEMPVGTIVALIDHQTKPQSAVQARIYAAFAEELTMIKDILVSTGHQYMSPGNAQYDFVADAKLPINIIPAADPSASSSAVRVLQSQAAVEMSARNPLMYDQPYVHRAMLKAMGVGDADAMVPDKDKILPADPLTENLSVLAGKPIKAGKDQDHKAHIAVHMAMMQDPMMMQTVGQSPMGQTVMAALTAHMAEHAGMAQREEILAQMGITLPDGPIPPDVEKRLAPLIAQAVMARTQANQQQMQQQQNQQQMQDPVVAMQAEDLRLRQEKQDRQFTLDIEELKLKAKKDGADIAIDAHKLDAERRQAGADLVERVLSGKTTVPQTGAGAP